MNASQRTAYGIGTAWYKSSPGAIDRKTVDAIKTAIGLGYRHIDCAQAYGNEEECGIALKELPPSISRSDLFITTKYKPSTTGNAVDALKESLQKLQLPKVDLYLIHFPWFETREGYPDVETMWQQMEQCHAAGLTSHIGVSNFHRRHIDRTLAVAKLPIYANQIECHPYHQQDDILACCREHDIIVESYCPLAPLVHKTDGPLAKPLEELAHKYSKTTGQILLRWNAQKGNVIVTTSSKESRMKEQLDIHSFELSKEDVAKIDDIGGTIDYRKYDQ